MPASKHKTSESNTDFTNGLTEQERGEFQRNATHPPNYGGFAISKGEKTLLILSPAHMQALR